MTRRLRVGDGVTLEGVVRYVSLDGLSVDVTVREDRVITAPMDCLNLVAPAEPPAGSIVVKDGIAWVRDNVYEAYEAYPWFSVQGQGKWRAWEDISDGEVIFTP